MKTTHKIPFSKNDSKDSLALIKKEIVSLAKKNKYELDDTETDKLTGLITDQVSTYIDTITRGRHPWTFASEYLPVLIIDLTNKEKSRGMFNEKVKNDEAFLKIKGVWHKVLKDDYENSILLNYDEFCTLSIQELKSDITTTAFYAFQSWVTPYE